MLSLGNHLLASAEILWLKNSLFLTCLGFCSLFQLSPKASVFISLQRIFSGCMRHDTVCINLCFLMAELYPTHKHTFRLWLFSGCCGHSNVSSPIFHQALPKCVQRGPGCVKSHQEGRRTGLGARCEVTKHSQISLWRGRGDMYGWQEECLRHGG